MQRKDVWRRCKGKALENIRFRHPFYDRESPVYLGEYVTLDTGTGIVHSAPAYGVEDFESCRRYGMKDEEILTPVHGRRQVRRLAAAVRRAVDLGREPEDRQGDRGEGRAARGGLEAHAQLHALLAPQDAGDPARHHAVVRVDGQDTVERRSRCAQTALRGIENTQFFPAWGQARLHGMIANRPDWTLSRQRQWGVPMPFFLHRETGALHPRTPELLEEVAKRVEKGGIEAWQAVTARGASGRRSVCTTRKAGTRSTSGSTRARTHFTVLRALAPGGVELSRPTCTWRARTSTAAGSTRRCSIVLHARRRAAVQASLLTHGFVIDLRRPQDVEVEAATCMAPQEISGTLGAEILRLWVASADYSGELTISERDPEARGGELPPHPQHAALPARQYLGLRPGEARGAGRGDGGDRPLRPRDDRARCRRQATADYARYQFHLVAQKLQAFCSEDLGAFYLDILKDRLYTCGADSRAAALGADRALAHHAQPGAPDGADPVLHRRGAVAAVRRQERRQRVLPHLARAAGARRTAPRCSRSGRRLRELRDPVRKQIEELRAAGKVGSSLQAEVDLRRRRPDYELLASLGDELKFLMMTSRGARRARRASSQVEGRAERATRNASAAGTTAPDVNGEGLCGALPDATCAAPGETRRHV